MRHLPLVRTFVRMNLDPGLRWQEEEAFDSLDEREQKLLSMRFIFRVQPTHIANELGSPESSVRKERGCR